MDIRDGYTRNLCVLVSLAAVPLGAFATGRGDPLADALGYAAVAVAVLAVALIGLDAVEREGTGLCRLDAGDAAVPTHVKGA